MKNKLRQLSQALADHEHAGMTFLRALCASNLRNMEKPFVLHHQAQPIAAIVPYQLFMAVQSALLEARLALGAALKGESDRNEPRYSI